MLNKGVYVLHEFYQIESAGFLYLNPETTPQKFVDFIERTAVAERLLWGQ